ncbi:MAG: Crp/Fnr family transcriptional regulator [Polyangiaceae bacterium]|nr:Crp/Fnr family transcriptional regulator [Polyangiaceae bacterium]MCW5790917.1 Crp/Fnr family transcriptional regulator [Polyangiaceae bacterium]
MDGTSEVLDQERLLARFGQRFTTGDVVFSEGDAATHAFLLQEGRVRLIKRVGAVERSLRVVRPGDLFGESALLQGAPRNSTAVALSDGAVLALDHETFQHVLSANPAVGTRVLHQLIRRLRDAEDQIEILMLRDSQAKVVVALLKSAQHSLGSRGGVEGAVTLSVSPLDLSVRVGLDVDTVKRTVQQLRESGYISIVDETIEIPDAGALRELYSLLGVKDQIRGPAPEPRRS